LGRGFFSSGCGSGIPWIACEGRFGRLRFGATSERGIRLICCRLRIRLVAVVPSRTIAFHPLQVRAGRRTK
jgi:hypothetical protein